jgi:hypothetical protein
MVCGLAPCESEFEERTREIENSELARRAAALDFGKKDGVGPGAGASKAPNQAGGRRWGGARFVQETAAKMGQTEGPIGRSPFCNDFNLIWNVGCSVVRQDGITGDYNN